eukprot:1158208-Pelagomonas_calceolata.AAC.40
MHAIQKQRACGKGALNQHPQGATSKEGKWSGGFSNRRRMEGGHEGGHEGVPEGEAVTDAMKELPCEWL